MRTVGDFIDALSAFPKDWPVDVSTPAGGKITIEHRDIRGTPFVAIFGANGGCIGENPLTEEEYAAKSAEFLQKFNSPDYVYTTIHGDHRLCYLWPGVSVDTCYGVHYDRRIVERMVKEGLITLPAAELERVAYLDR